MEYRYSWQHMIITLCAVLCYNLSKTENGQILCKPAPEYTKLSDNSLERANEDLFEAVVSNAVGVDEVSEFIIEEGNLRFGFTHCGRPVKSDTYSNGGLLGSICKK